MKRAWIRKVKGSRLLNAADVSSCEENDSPLCFSHSVPRPVSRLQMGRLSLTKIFFSARVSAWSIENRAVPLIGALPARSCATDLHARVALPNLWPAVSARDLIPTNERQTFPRQA